MSDDSDEDLLLGEDLFVNHILPSLLKVEKRRLKRKKKFDCWDSPWGHLISNPDTSKEDSTAGRMFRMRFRVPFLLFQNFLVPMVEQKQIFRGINSYIPVECKVLISLRILGRGLYMDDAAELSGVSERHTRRIFYAFCQGIKKYLYPELVFNTV